MSRFSTRRGVALLLCCAAATAADAAGTPAEQPLTALPYTPGLDVTAIDRSAAPCADFYQYACGAWNQRNPIPADESAWGVYQKLQDENTRFLWGLLQTAAEPGAERSVHVQKAGDYFAACMARHDDAPGLEALAGPLEAIAQLKSVKAMAPLLASLDAQFDASPFSFYAAQDPADSTRMLATVDAGGLGLPDRDHYIKRDKASLALLRAYRQHLERVFALAGDAPAAARAAARTVLGIETTLARATLTGEQQRDPRSIYHRMSLRQLQRHAPAFDWAAYLTAHGVPPDQPLNVTQPAFLRTLSVLLRGKPLADWRTYLRWHLLRAQAPYLSAPWAQANFDFFEKELQGVQAMAPRWKQCVQWADRDVGEALGQLFVEKTFSPETRQRVQTMTAHVQTAMQARIDALDWMSPATKAAASAKLKAVVNKIGYPERWRDYGALAIAPDDFIGNVQRSLAFERRRQLAKIGQPVERDDWFMTPPTVNAYYDPPLNSINFPAGILQPPLFDPLMDDAPSYGNTGATIGHELTHAFDDEGRQFDAQGNLRNWWTPRDEAAFKRKAQCVVDQYSQYTVVDGIKVNGKLTLGEDLADLGGTLLAYAAWQAATAGQTLVESDGYSPEQRFFIGMAQWACGDQRPEAQRLGAITDRHSPERYRVNGVLANMPEFAKAFACKPGAPMVRAKTCKVW